MTDRIKAVVKGHDCDKNPFEETLEFRLDRPKEGESYYGTGCYMLVTAPWDKWYVDARYQHTTKLDVLATRWIENYFGKNAEEVRFEEVGA